VVTLLKSHAVLTESQFLENHRAEGEEDGKPISFSIKPLRL